MSFVIYKDDEDGRRWYLADLPADDNPIGGIGYRGSNDGRVPEEAGTCPTEDDAMKLCEYLKTAFYGTPEEHFYLEVAS